MNSRQALAVGFAKDGHNIFVTGDVDTGKTTTIVEMMKTLHSIGKRVAVTASTGLASKQIVGKYHTIQVMTYP